MNYLIFYQPHWFQLHLATFAKAGFIEEQRNNIQLQDSLLNDMILIRILDCIWKVD